MDFDIDNSVENVNALLNSSSSMDANKSKSRKEQLVPSRKKPNPSLESPPKLKLKSLLGTLEYVLLREENTSSVIVSSFLDDKQKSKLLSILREHKEISGWTIVDVKGISPVDCMHYIHFVTLHYIIYLKILKNTVTFNINTNSKSLQQTKLSYKKYESYRNSLV